jgi:peptidoglycan/xylan/chitin deacetylase (PgdA/CDA1 family)
MTASSINRLQKLKLKLKPYVLPKNIYGITYHGIVEKRTFPFWERNFTELSDFQEHLKFYSKYQVLSPEELFYYTSNQLAPKKASFFITFDDGYENNLIAAALLSKYKMPWTLFVSTDNITTGEYIWTIDLALLFSFTSKTSVAYSGTNYALGTEQNRMKAFNEIRKLIKKEPQIQRLQELQKLQELLKVSDITVLRAKMPMFKMLNWDQVKGLDNYATIGSHGATHELMHSQQTDETINFEIKESKAAIEKQLNKPCELFAYPNGDYCDKAIESILESGYRLAFTTKHENASPQYDPFLFPRRDAAVNLDKLKLSLLKD